MEGVSNTPVNEMVTCLGVSDASKREAVATEVRKRLSYAKESFHLEASPTDE